MIDQEHDWLDERLAESPYLPNGGFTQRVIDHLPQSTLKHAGRIRRRILAASSFCALALGAALAVTDLPSLVQELVKFADSSPVNQAAGHFAEFIRQPMIFFGGAATITLSAFAILPFLRRWV